MKILESPVIRGSYEERDFSSSPPSNKGEKLVVGVQLGRVSPYTLGHAMVTAAIRERFEHCMMLIGSSNVPLSDRTAYTFKQRMGMVHAVHSDLTVLDLPDVNPMRRECKSDTFAEWRRGLREFMERMNAEFVFCGGSEEDLAALKPDFSTQVIVDRRIAGSGINATAVRAAIAKGDRQFLEASLDPRVIPLAVRFFEENKAEIEENRRRFPQLFAK